MSDEDSSGYRCGACGLSHRFRGACHNVSTDNATPVEIAPLGKPFTIPAIPVSEESNRLVDELFAQRKTGPADWIKERIGDIENDPEYLKEMVKLLKEKLALVSPAPREDVRALVEAAGMVIAAEDVGAARPIGMLRRAIARVKAAEPLTSPDAIKENGAKLEQGAAE